MNNHLFFLIILVLYNQVFYSQEKDHSQLKLNCRSCHSCQVPTKDDPCLHECPRYSMIREDPAPNSGPNIVVLDAIKDQYLPVIFPHNLHAQMSEMTGGCLACHHHNTLGPIISCVECHSKTRQREDIRVPDLKGALHQKCLSCHRQWSRKTECVSCHAKKDDKESWTITEVSSEFEMKSHPNVKQPNKIVYETIYSINKLVTFFHNDHTKQFALDCVSCHKNENCIRCHDSKKTLNVKNGYYDHPLKVDISEELRHSRCFDCHENNKCSFCHKNKITEPFNHLSRTGWALSNYHKNLSCSKCHESKIDYTGLNNECLSCHSVWNSGNFNHGITDLMLDENHVDNDCIDCHKESIFAENIRCDDCHDEITYPDRIPGKLINTD